MPLPDHRLTMSLAGLPNGTHQPNSRPQSWNVTVPMSHQISLANIGKVPPGRDPRSRQRSKEYLKQSVINHTFYHLVSNKLFSFFTFRCLQEMTYLTSTHALNPLPNRPLLSSSSLPVSIPNVPQFDQAAFNGRPRKIVPDNSTIAMGIPSTSVAKPLEQIQHVNGIAFPTLSNPPGLTQQQNDRGGSTVPSHLPLQSHTTSPASQTSTTSFPTQTQSNERVITGDIHTDATRSNVTEPVTVIFRPDDTWRDQLRRAREASLNAPEDATSEQLHFKNVSGAESWDGRSPDDEDDDAREEEDDTEAEEVNLADENEGSKVWRAKRILRKFVHIFYLFFARISLSNSMLHSHLDTVRAIAFHSQETYLATGGDDCTIKIWRLDPQSLSSST